MHRAVEPAGLVRRDWKNVRRDLRFAKGHKEPTTCQFLRKLWGAMMRPLNGNFEIVRGSSWRSSVSDYASTCLNHTVQVTCLLDRCVRDSSSCTRVVSNSSFERSFWWPLYRWDRCDNSGMGRSVYSGERVAGLKNPNRKIDSGRAFPLPALARIGVRASAYSWHGGELR